jgi:hypothetical protein
MKMRLGFNLWCQLTAMNVSFVIACSMVIAFADSSVASGTDADTAAQAQAAKSAPRVLNGSAKEREKVTSSIRLVLPTPEPHLLTGAQSHVLNGSAQTGLLNGSAQSRTLNGSAGTTPLNSQASANPKPVKPVPAFSAPNAPRPDVYHPILPSRITVIPERTYIKPQAKWNYTMTPKNGIMTWSAGYASTKVTPQPHVATQAQPTTKPALQQTSVSASMQQQIGIVPVAQRAQINTALVHPSVNGVVQPGTKKGEAALEATAKKMATPATPPPAVALQAIPKLLTERSDMKRSINWDEWYKRVCQVVYDNWEIDQANPGKSCVRVTVWAGREIEARVLSFTPAQGASRDAKRETAFRETSLRAVNSLQKTPVLDFPLRSNRGKIIFDLDMTRAVDGPSGIQVAAFHDVEEVTGPGSYKNSTRASASSSESARTAGASPPHVFVKASAKYVAAKSTAKSAAKYSQTSNSAPAPEPAKDTSAPNAFQTAAQSLASQAFRSSMDAANAVSKHLQFLRWKDPSAPAVDSKKQ